MPAPEFMYRSIWEPSVKMCSHLSGVYLIFFFEVCHPRCVVYNNVLTCRTLYLVNTTVVLTKYSVLHADILCFQSQVPKIVSSFFSLYYVLLQV